jgi:nuclear pore complex protein Nup93
VIEELDLIPLEANMAIIAKKADQFQGLDECVARNFPDVLLKTMESLYKLYQAFKMSPYDQTGRREVKINATGTCLYFILFYSQ